jgi:hypothetical protein
MHGPQQRINKYKKYSANFYNTPPTARSEEKLATGGLMPGLNGNPSFVNCCTSIVDKKMYQPAKCQNPCQTFPILVVLYR